MLNEEQSDQPFGWFSRLGDAVKKEGRKSKIKKKKNSSLYKKEDYLSSIYISALISSELDQVSI